MYSSNKPVEFSALNYTRSYIFCLCIIMQKSCCGFWQFCTRKGHFLPRAAPGHTGRDKVTENQPLIKAPSFMMTRILSTAMARMFSRGLPSITSRSADFPASRVPATSSTFRISLPQCQVMNSKKGKKYPLSIKRRGDICDTNYNLFAFQRIHKIIAKRP